MNDYLILVDDKDNVIGYSEKMKAHIEKTRHRAFSIFILCVQRSWTTLAGESPVTVIASEPCS